MVCIDLYEKKVPYILCTSFFFLTHFFCPIYYLGAMKDNIDLVRRGILVLLPEPDDRGRAIIYFDPLKRDDDTADNDKVFNIVGLFFLISIVH